ncbi:MAG: tRNA-dihydrouridine synthase, partial [Deltaproteobacteria bacterium]|nr:tRNA-dihydrouridine synthase [Nannocystaceae bacterium]
SELPVLDLVRDAERWGAAAVLYTDVARDGLQRGPAVDATRTLQSAVEIPVLASGGVGSLADLEACRDAGIRGVIVGRALYERAFTIEEALQRC